MFLKNVPSYVSHMYPTEISVLSICLRNSTFYKSMFVQYDFLVWGPVGLPHLYLPRRVFSMYSAALEKYPVKVFVSGLGPETSEDLGVTLGSTGNTMSDRCMQIYDTLLRRYQSEGLP